jgi:hypothetical protein
MSAFEAEEKRQLGPSEDTVGFLWSCDLQGITYNAIDGIGDEEVGDDEPERGKEDYRALVAELVSKIQRPAEPTTGQSYAFVLDADVRVGASDFHYEATTTRKAFEENPTILDLTGGGGPAGGGRERGREGAARPFRGRPLRRPHGHGAERVGGGPGPGVREAARGLLGSLGLRLPERLPLPPAPRGRERARSRNPPAGPRHGREVREPRSGPQDARDRAEDGPLRPGHARLGPGGDEAWPLLVDFLARLPEGTLRNELVAYLRGRLRASPGLLRQTLASPAPHRIRAGLAIVDETLEGVCAKELLDLAVHPNEAIRLKALGFAARLAGVEILWRAMEDDPAKSVRLLAFRVIAQAREPGLASRLTTIVTSPAFADRPAWEQEKYVRLLGSVAGESAAPLFQSWIPTRRWFWKSGDYESAEVALHGLAACGGASLARVKAHAAGGGKLGDIARRVMESVAGTATETGETTMGREPAAGRGR